MACAEKGTVIEGRKKNPRGQLGVCTIWKEVLRSDLRQDHLSAFFVVNITILVLGRHKKTNKSTKAISQ